MKTEMLISDCFLIYPRVCVECEKTKFAFLVVWILDKIMSLAQLDCKSGPTVTF